MRIRRVQSYAARTRNLDGGGGCRVVIYAARLAIHPPTTANGINPSCPISPERFHLPLPPPSFSFALSLCLCPYALYLLVPPISPFFDSSPDPTSALSNQVLRAFALIFPLPGFVSIVPRSWWCQPRAPKRA